MGIADFSAYLAEAATSDVGGAVGADDSLAWAARHLGAPGGLIVLLLAGLRWAVPPVMEKWKEISAAKAVAEQRIADASAKLMDGQLRVNESQQALTKTLNEAHFGARELLRDIERLHDKVKAQAA